MIRFYSKSCWAIFSALLAASSAHADSNPQHDWEHYGRTLHATRYSTLSQITPENVKDLKPVWTHRSGVLLKKMSVEATPLKIGNALYFCTPNNIIISLNAETGKERWRHKPNLDPAVLTGHVTCRGIAYYRAPEGTECRERIILASLDMQIIAINARNGKLCSSFGKGGSVDLKNGLGEVRTGYAANRSPPLIVNNRIILGGMIMDGQTTDVPSGVIRAYDAVTGKFVWAWDAGRPGIHTEPAPGEHYTRGTPNAWGVFSADPKLGLAYIPTGNPSPDYYGGNRSPAMEKYGSSVVALDVETGSVRWSFQAIHHDIWDYDIGAQPVLTDVPTGKGVVPALLQPTKTGQVFMLDRRTGDPIARIEEREVPQGNVPGERYSRTQPFNAELPSFEGPKLTERDMWGITPFDQLWCRIQFRRAHYEGTYTPLALDKPSVVTPGYAGGFGWGSVAVDEGRHIMVVNVNHVGNYNQLITREKVNKMGVKMIGEKGGPKSLAGKVVHPQVGTPYGAIISPFLSPLGIPCQRPPYGILAAVNLKTKKLLWQKNFGTAQDSGAFGLKLGLPIPMGVPNIGGAVTTKSGLLFIGATQDAYLRGYDIKTGKELWRARLPAGAQATPLLYHSEKSGRDFLVVSAGGSGLLKSKPGDYIMAFALPQPPKKPAGASAKP